MLAMKKLVIVPFLLLNMTLAQADYKQSDCYKAYAAKSKEKRDKIKHKEDNPPWYEGIAGFFCSIDKAAASSKYAGALTQLDKSAKYDDCDNPIDYFRLINTQVIQNFAYANAHRAGAASSKGCSSDPGCKKSVWGSNKKDNKVKGSMTFAKEVYDQARGINPDISSWSSIQEIVQNGFVSGGLCKKNGKPKSRRKAIKYILAQVKKESVASSKEVDDSTRSQKQINTSEENQNNHDSFGSLKE